jgi:hypothetical protein
MLIEAQITGGRSSGRNNQPAAILIATLRDCRLE